MAMSARTIFFVGKPGSGKGIQADLLSKKTGWPIIGISDGLRELIARGDAVGHKIKETMDAGLLTPDWLPSYVYLKSLFALREDQSVIFDGTSRTLAQAQIVADSVKWLGRDLSVIHLQTSDEEIRNRIALRKEKEGRTDDHEHAIVTRIKTYYDLTHKVIEFFRESGILMEVNGEGTPEAIAEEVRKVLGLA